MCRSILLILPDNDKAGGEHRDALRAALAPVVASIRILEMPEGIKDVSDYVASFPVAKDAGRELLRMLEAAEVLYRGEAVPIQSIAEMEAIYRDHCQKSATHQLDLSAWLPLQKRNRGNGKSH